MLLIIVLIAGISLIHVFFMFLAILKRLHLSNCQLIFSMSQYSVTVVQLMSILGLLLHLQAPLNGVLEVMLCTVVLAILEV